MAVLASGVVVMVGGLGCDIGKMKFYRTTPGPRRHNEAAGAIFDSDLREARVREACGGLEEVGHREVWLRWEGWEVWFV